MPTEQRSKRRRRHKPKGRTLKSPPSMDMSVYPIDMSDYVKEPPRVDN